MNNKTLKITEPEKLVRRRIENRIEQNSTPTEAG
jgi:hypothetical protein